MDITTLGYYGFRNSGDEAFKDALQTLFPERRFKFRSEALSDDDVHGDRLILGPGDAIYEYFLERLPETAGFDIVGAGLPYGHGSLELLEPYRQRINKMYLRNRIDTAIAREAGYDAHYIPDLVMALTPPSDPIPLPIERRKGKLMVIFLSDHCNSAYSMHDVRLNHYYEYLKWEMSLITTYLSKYYDMLFVPLSWDPMRPDWRISLDVRLRSEPLEATNYVILDRELTPLEIISILQQADAAMSMKFHGLVYSLVAGIPCVNIGYTRKSQLIMSENGLGRLNVEPFAIEKERVLACFKAAEDEEVRAGVRETGARLKAELGDVAAEIERGWSEVG